MTNVTLITNKFPSLSETFIVNQIKLLQADVFSRIAQPHLIARYGLEEVVHDSLHVDQEGPTKRLVRRLTNKIRNIPAFVYDEDHRGRLKEFLLRQRTGVVLAQYGPNGLSAWPVCRQLRLPLVIHFHGYDLSTLLRSKWYVNQLKEALPHLAGMVTVNFEQREKLLQLGAVAARIHVIPCGVNVSNFAPVYAPPTPTFRFIAVGRFVPKKSPLRTLRAFEICADAVPDVQLTMIGDGPLHQAATTYAAASRHRDRITLTGKVHNQEISSYLQRAHGFVQHSITAPTGDREGWPISIAEAMACGLPIVSTRHAGIKDQVVEGVNGYLCEEQDVVAMGANLIKVASHPEGWERMGRASRKRIEEIGDLYRQVDELATVLQRAV